MCFVGYFLAAKMSKSNRLRTQLLSKAAQNSNNPTLSGTATSLAFTPVQGRCYETSCLFSHLSDGLSFMLVQESKLLPHRCLPHRGSQRQTTGGLVAERSRTSKRRRATFLDRTAPGRVDLDDSLRVYHGIDIYTCNHDRALYHNSCEIQMRA
jgi:hypothetical protein